MRISLDAMIKHEMDKLPRGGDCLNLGSGTKSRYAELLTEMSVSAIDLLPPPDSLPANWKYYQSTAEQTGFSDASFDLVFSIEVFEHIQNNLAASREVCRVLKRAGRILLTVPTAYTWPWEFGRHSPHYYTRNSIKYLLESGGMTILSIRTCGGLGYFVLQSAKSWLSPIGVRLFGPDRWWRWCDRVLSPLFAVAHILDKFLPWPPCHFVITAQK